MALHLERASEALAADPTVREALDCYFRENGFDPTYSERWVKLRVGPLVVAFPSTRSRVAAARLHDVHHLVTAYETDWRGEAEIAAWELGGGCGRFWPAWLLNIGAFGIGLMIAPRRVLHAFLRGRRSETLYRELPSPFYSHPIAELQSCLLSDEEPTSMVDRLAFVGLVLITVVAAVLFPITAVVFMISLYLPAPAVQA